MKLADAIRSPKIVDSHGNWCTGDIDRSSWPMRKKKLKQSSDWSWRVVSISANDRKFRVLLKLNPSIEQFYAILGEVTNDAIAVICSHDLHTSHGNWHCHATTVEIEEVFAGAWRDRDSLRRWPSYNGVCSETFDVDREKAMILAANLYRFALPPQHELFL